MSLALLSDLVDSLDGVDRLRPQLAVVFYWNIAALLEFEARIDRELFAGELAVNFRPLCLAGILLSVERFAALLPAESELLKRVVRLRWEVLDLKILRTYFAIVSHEQHSMAWVDLAGAEIAGLDPHCVIACRSCESGKVEMFSFLSSTRFQAQKSQMHLPLDSKFKFNAGSANV